MPCLVAGAATCAQPVLHGRQHSTHIHHDHAALLPSAAALLDDGEVDVHEGIGAVRLLHPGVCVNQARRELGRNCSAECTYQHHQKKAPVTPISQQSTATSTPLSFVC